MSEEPQLRFLFDLGLAVGEWDIEGLAERMPLRLMFLWQAYQQMNPWGEWRADWRAGMLAATLVNTNPHVRVRNKKPRDFMPEFGVRRKQTPKEMYEALKTGLMLWGGKKVGD